jgi:hypothetical protein
VQSKHRPHHGSPAQPGAALGANSTVPGDKHCMLSYNWAVQESATKARKLLQKAGVKCWMDIGEHFHHSIACETGPLWHVLTALTRARADGGMQSDIFGEMKNQLPQLAQELSLSDVT